LLALLVLATPVLAISAFWRQRKLRLQIEELAHQTSRQNDALHRELLELRRQMSAVVQPATPTPHPEAAQSTVSVAASKASQPVVLEQTPQPTLKDTPAKPITAPLSVPAAKTEPILCPWCSTAHAGGVSNCPPAKPTTPATEMPRVEVAPSAVILRGVEVPVRTSIPSESKAPVADETSERTAGAEKTGATEVAKAVQPVHAMSKAPLQPPSASPPTIPPKSSPPPPVAHDQFVPLRIPVEGSVGARAVEPPQFATLRSTTPKVTSQQRMKSVFALEETLGTNWLNKLGITILVLGLALFGIYELGQLGPAGKVGLSYVVSLALLAGGVSFERRERYRVLGHTLIGGGWALLFFTTYALNHVQAMRVMSSENTDLICMLAVALAMVAHTLSYRSQLVTGLAFLLAYTTVSLSHDDVYSLSSGVILAIGLVSIVIKMEWFELEVFGILSSYLNHLYWLYRLLGPEGAHGHAFSEYHASTALLLFYWLIFRVSYIVRKAESPRAEHVSTAAALLNTLLLLGTMKFQSVQPELAFVALLIIGAVEFSLAQLPITKRRREAFIVLSVLGAALMITAVPFRYSGNNVAILWLIGGEALLLAGVLFSEVVFRRLGLFAGVLVGLHLIGIDFRQLVAVRENSEELFLAAGVMFALCATIFYLNALLIGKRWRLFFVQAPDSQLLCGHSYLGAFAAVSAGWALCSRDWTALAFAGIMLVLAALGHKFNSPHLQVQYGVIGALAAYRVAVVNLHSEAAPHIHISARLITLPIVAAMFYVAAKFSQLRNDSNQRTFRGLFALAGTAFLAALIYYEVPELWQPVAAIMFAVALLEVGQSIGYRTLAWHAHLLSGLAVLAALTADQAGAQRWHDVPLHALGALPVVAGLYWIARRIALPNTDHVNMARIAYSWAGTALMLWVLNEAVPPPWIAVSWIAFAVVVAFVMRRVGYRQLAWQANVAAACAVGRAYTANFTLEQSVWSGVSLRLVTVSLVAAGLYFLSRKAAISDSPTKPAITYLHTFAATALLAFLAWYEAPGAWLAAVWAIFALVLALVDRRFELDDLRWQAHALAVLAMLRSVSLNLYINESWHGFSFRLLSLAVVTVVMYALAQIIRMPVELRARELHHIYSWAASALVSLLMWYELQPLSVADGWAVFGLVLFEYGLLRNTRQFRFQAYLALTAAFGRIFFANLAAANPGELWGPRIYTVLPLTLIFFFVYAQLANDDRDTEDDRRLHFHDLICYLATASVVALLYFQFAGDWLVTAWAAVVFILFGAALLLDRSIFLHQGILLTVGTGVRGIMHNLFGASYFTGGDWTGRYFVLGSAVALLLACLPFAFRLRQRGKQQTLRFRWLAALARRPEQFMFFVPVLLLTLMLALKMRAGMVTVAWGIEGVLIVLLALAVNERSFRLTGLILLLVCVGKIIVRDAWGLAPRDRYVTFIILGAALLLVSFLYSKYRETIRQFL
jgi:hypothetical protein